jgi:hypothetical protein
VAALAAGLAGAGCVADGPGRPETGSVTGIIINLADGAPVTGALVVLFNPATNAPGALPAVTGRDGRYRIDAISPGWYYLVTWAGDRLAYEPAAGAFIVHPGATATHDVLVAPLPHAVGEDGRPVSGRVEDAVTGEPLAGASVSIGSTDAGLLFSGAGVPWEATTDARGAFLLTLVPVARDEWFNPVGILPVIAAAEGYLPGGTGSTGRGEWLPLPPAGDTVQVVIRLAPGRGAASVRGRFVHDGRPVAGVPVALAMVDTAAGVAGPPARSAPLAPDRLAPRALVPGLLDLSDPGGDFEIRNVPPGRYFLHAAYLPDDGWVYLAPEWPGEAKPFTVSGKDVDLGERSVIPGIPVVSPPPGGWVDTGHPWLRWRRVAEADTYMVTWSRANHFWLTEGTATTDTAFQVPPGLWGDGDHARWAVYAYRTGLPVAGMETIAAFEVRSYSWGGPSGTGLANSQ